MVAERDGGVRALLKLGCSCSSTLCSVRER